MQQDALHAGATLFRGRHSGRQPAHHLAPSLLGILPGGPTRWAAFLRSLPLRQPAQIPSVISDWIIGLSMADFARRRLEAPASTPVADRCLASGRTAMARYIEAGRASLNIAPAPAPSVLVSLHGLVDRRFFVRAARSLERWLKHTPATVTLRIDALREAETRHLERLLHRLRRYGDRVSIDLDERLRCVVSIDSSVFNLVLTGALRGNP